MQILRVNKRHVSAYKSTMCEKIRRTLLQNIFYELSRVSLSLSLSLYLSLSLFCPFTPLQSLGLTLKLSIPVSLSLSKALPSILS